MSESANSLMLPGARSITEASAGTVHIAAQIDAIEKAIVDNPNLAIDLSKTLIESVCKTILNDRGHKVNEKDNLPRLLKEAFVCLRLLPDSYAGDGNLRTSLESAVRGLQTTVNALCDLRNSHGFASHGKDGYRLPLDRVQAELAARAADAIVTFLYGSHRAYTVDPRIARLQYGQEPTFDEFVDDLHQPITVFDLVYKPSEVLFELDGQAYRDKLAEFRSEIATNQASESEDSGVGEESSNPARAAEVGGE